MPDSQPKEPPQKPDAPNGTAGAPSVAVGDLFLATSQALALAAQNATNNQQQTYVTMQAATTQAVMTLLSIESAAVSEAARTVITQGR